MKSSVSQSAAEQQYLEEGIAILEMSKSARRLLEPRAADAGAEASEFCGFEHLQLMFPRADGIGSKEIRWVSRREINQAGRDPLALARLAILETWPTQQLHPGPCNFPGSCNPSVMRSYFAPA
jgi:hypothetical protein